MTTTRDSILDIWGTRSPYHGEGRWPERVDERTSQEPEVWVQSACVLCSNGCGLDIGVKGGRIVGVRGRALDTVNRGRLGPKGLHGWEANNSPDRLTRPLIRRNGTLVPTNWDEAMNIIVSQVQEIRERYTATAIGLYTSGQMFLEEYYTLGVIAKAGLGTPHLDGNTRLCTATAAAALKETFGSDGQPGSYLDIDVTDCLLHVGHNLSHTDTVLWMRVLDRRGGPNAPKLIVIDPRRTKTAAEADLHLAPKMGTNVAVLNGLINRLVEASYIDRDFIARHTVGFDELSEVVRSYTPARVEAISGIPAAQLRAAADLIGASKMLVSSCLQGVYQSNQSTAAAVQVNNINLILGRIGRPGCGVLQMNGQPTAQNTRETGANGDLPGFRNWENPTHIDELARIWNIDPAIIPHWGPPTHALQIFRYCEIGSIRMLWIQATNPAVSLPDLARVRSILQNPDLFIVVQDAFPTETMEFADVVLPAALWGEKAGTFTNADRTVHISHKAVEPPGEARADFDIFLDFARRMDFRDKDGAPLIKWATPVEAFEAWKECSRGRPCDYTGLSYANLSAGSGICWPCNAHHPDGEPRPYKTLQFPTDHAECESYGHDLVTGGAISSEQYRAGNPAGRAILKAAEYQSPAEEPDDAYPFLLTTGRLVYHFHTRTKTGRSKDLRDASPSDFVQIATEDAARLGIKDGSWIRLTSRRGSLETRVRLGEVAPGELFAPFHFGYWDNPGRPRAANEITIYGWDPVSKQPCFKYAAVKLERIRGHKRQQPKNVATDLCPGALGTIKVGAKALGEAKSAPPRARLPDYLGLLQRSERRLRKALDQVRATHPNEPDIVAMCTLFREWWQAADQQLKPFIEKYSGGLAGDPEKFDEGAVVQREQGGFDLLCDLHELCLLVNDSLISLTVIKQAAQVLQDQELEQAIQQIRRQHQRQQSWLMTRLRDTAPQTLVVPS